MATTSMTQFDDLDDDCLLEVLDRVSPNNLFMLMHVNRRLNLLAAEKIRDKIKSELKVIFLNLLSLPAYTRLNHMQDVELFFEKKSLDFKILTPFNDSNQHRVNSINISRFYLSDGFHLEFVKFCSEIESKVGYFTKEKFYRIIDRIGHRLVNIVIRGHEKVRLLAMVAEKCPNIKRLEWRMIRSDLTSDLLAAFKMLPKSCCIRLECSSLNAFEDVFDELDVDYLNWSLFGHRLDRLSSLKIYSRLHGLVRGVDFPNLKKLEYRPPQLKWRYNQAELTMLSSSRFPRLEEFCFDASRGLTEDDYKELFKRMRSVKKLIIFCNWSSDRDFYVPERLPRSSILKLNKLNTIEVKIWQLPKEWQPQDFLKHLKQYVNNIGSLKKLSVEFVERHNYEWEKTVEDEIKRMKMEQNRVEVD